MALVDDDKKLINLPRLSTYDNLIKARFNNCIKNVVYYEVTGNESEDITVPGSEINDTVTSAGYTWSSNKITEELASKADAVHTHGVVKSIELSGGTLSYTMDNGQTESYEMQGAAYETGTADVSGLTKLYTGTGVNTDGTMTQNAITEALNSKSDSAHSHTAQEVGALPEDGLLKYFPAGEYPNLIVPVPSEGKVEYPNISLSFSNDDQILRLRVTESENNYFQLRLTDDFNTSFFDVSTDGVASSQPIRCLPLDGSLPMRSFINFKNDDSYIGKGLVYKNHSSTEDYGMTIKDFESDDVCVSLTISAKDNTIKFTTQDGTIYTIYGAHNLSTATSAVQGLVKLYTALGTATDGTMTQNAINTELGKKLSLTGGTMTGSAVMKNDTDYGMSRARNIQASTTDLTAGTSALDNGAIYLVYE